MKLLVRLQHLIVRTGLAPGRRITTPWLLRFVAACLVSLLLWTVCLWGAAGLAEWLFPYGR